MSVFLNDKNQYDMSVDNVSFSSLYNQTQGAANPQPTVQASPDPFAQGQKAPEQPGQVQDFGFSFNPGTFGQSGSSQQRPPQPQGFGTTVQYENPEKIFSNGTNFGEFKFDGFGKDAWGIYSGSGFDGQQAQKPQDYFANPFDKSQATAVPEVFPQADDTASQIWVKDAPLEAKVVEDSSKGKKGFL